MSRGPGRRLTVLGGYGGVNTGDEMILRAIVEQARRAGYRGTVNVIGGRMPAAAAEEADYRQRGLRPVSWRQIQAAARAAVGRDLFIGGGQIIDGVAGVKFPAIKLGLAAIARATGGRITIGGVSTARLDRPSVRRAYDKLFRLAARIAARDSASTADICAITPSAAARIETLSDVVFGMEDVLRGERAARERNRIAFAVHHAPTFHHTGFEETLGFLRRLTDAAAGKFQIAILAHDMRADWDRGLAERLAREIASPAVEALILPTTDECIAFYRQARTVISARMHPIIIGACAGAFCVPLASSRKVADMAARLEIPQWELADLSRLDGDAFARAVGLLDDGPSASEAAVSRMAEEARRVFVAEGADGGAERWR